MEGKGYGQPPGSLDPERQEGQGRGDLVCHVAELQRQEWNIVPAPPREAPQLHSPCSPAWGLTRARKVSEIPLHAQASLPLPPQGSRCLCSGSRIARTGNRGESEDLEQNSKEGAASPEVCVCLRRKVWRE